MREMGYDPSTNLRSWTQDALESDEIDGLEDQILRTLHHSRWILELAEPSLLATVEACFGRHSWDLEPGRYLARFIAESDPCDPDMFGQVLATCAEQLLGDLAGFSVAGWDHVPRGSFADPRVIILVQPRA